MSIIGSQNLPKARSQGASSSPITRAPEGESLLSQLLQQTPAIASAFVKMNNNSTKEAINAQGTEDSENIGRYIGELEGVNQGFDNIQQAEEGVMQSSVRLAQGAADGEIGQQDYRNFSDFNNSMGAFETARAQKGPRSSQQVRMQQRSLLQKSLAADPKNGEKYYDLYRKATGSGPSNTSGTQAKEALAERQKMEKIFGPDFGSEAALQMGRWKARAKENDMVMAQLEVEKAAGNARFAPVAMSSNNSYSIVEETIYAKVSTMVKSNGTDALNKDQMDVLSLNITQASEAILAEARTQVSGIMANKSGFVATEDYNKFRDGIRKRVSNTIALIQSKDVSKVITEGSALQRDLHAMQMGNYASKVFAAHKAGGEGVTLAARSMLNSTNPATRQAMNTLLENTGQGAMFNSLEEPMMNIINDLATPFPIPAGYEKAYILAGGLAMKAGKTEPPVTTKYLQGLGSVVKSAADIPIALNSLVDPAISRTIKTSTPEVHADFNNKLNVMESFLHKDMDGEKMYSTYDAGTDSVVIYQDEATPSLLRRIGRGMQIAQGHRISLEDLMKPIDEPVRQMEIDDPKMARIDRVATEAANSIYQIRKDPNYSGITQGGEDWLKTFLDTFDKKRFDTLTTE